MIKYKTIILAILSFYIIQNINSDIFIDNYQNKNNKYINSSLKFSITLDNNWNVLLKNYQIKKKIALSNIPNSETLFFGNSGDNSIFIFGVGIDKIDLNQFKIGYIESIKQTSTDYKFEDYFIHGILGYKCIYTIEKDNMIQKYLTFIFTNEKNQIIIISIFCPVSFFFDKNFLRIHDILDTLTIIKDFNPLTIKSKNNNYNGITTENIIEHHFGNIKEIRHYDNNYVLRELQDYYDFDPDQQRKMNREFKYFNNHGVKYKEEIYYNLKKSEDLIKTINYFNDSRNLIPISPNKIEDFYTENFITEKGYDKKIIYFDDIDISSIIKKEYYLKDNLLYTK